MIKVGELNTLKIKEILKNGAILGNDNLTNIFLSKKELSDNDHPNKTIKVFIYLNSKGDQVATKNTPYASVNRISKLKAVDKNSVGTFLDWGLPKEILLPHSEQVQDTVIGKSYLVMVYIDKKDSRIVASRKLDKFLSSLSDETLKEKQQVELIIERETELGRKVIINHKFWGVLHKSDIYQKFYYGEHLVGHIKKIRNDGKIDVCIQKPGYDKIEKISNYILNHIIQNNGIISITDKSDPKLISETFNISKATYKKALGYLYKNKKINILKDKIEIITTN